MRATWTKFDQILDEIQDPEAGLALLSKRPKGETPEQTLNLLFWHLQFTYWRDWRAGNVRAVSNALLVCALGIKRPPPTWLNRAVHELCKRCTPDDEKRAYGDLAKHRLRWQAVELVRGRFPGDPRNRKKKAHGDAVWVEAAKLVADTDAKASAETVRKSHTLIRRAGGMNATLQSYRRAVEGRDRGRKKIRVGSC
jgi:hypothetical protein